MTAFLLRWVLTASALILLVLLLRLAFGRRISARLRYALWALVLARLLVPGQFFSAPIETPRILPEPSAIQALPAVRPFPAEAKPDAAPVQALPAPAEESAAPQTPAPSKSLDPWAVLGWIWMAGTALMASAFLLSNLSFARRLRRVRVPLPAADSPLPVYQAAGLPSPCLFGLLRPAVYVTPETDPVCLRHVLAHETTHYRHGDHLWSLLRCAALAVHWWNPLAWLAAVLSRRDAELACDEGALKRLGDAERRAYGGTLLSLITAKPQPGDLFRCATTMTGDKRSLRERVGRIARAPKRWLWAAVLSVVLAALVCACSFAKTAETHPDGPLTQEELDHFNTEVFNGEGFNMMNQFLFLAVEAPKDYRQIDLFTLFYNGTGTFAPYTEEERQAVAEAAYDGEDPMVDLFKCTAGEMDAVLRKYTGLSLDETDKWCLDRFTYLEEYDAYYDFHGDTNYPGEVTFTSGEWKDGKVLLYYEGSGFPGLSSGNGEINCIGPACVTLEPQKDGGYRFLTNWSYDPPVTPTAYPAWDPELVIPLDSLDPCEPEPVALVRRAGDFAERLAATRYEPDEFSSDGVDIEVYRSTDGNRYAALKVSENERDCFLTIPYDASAEQITLEWCFNICGHDGFAITYPIMMGTYPTDYYYFDEDFRLFRLVSGTGGFHETDLDSDGQSELNWCPLGTGDEYRYFLFQREGRLYQTDLKALIREAWPEAGYVNGWGLDEAGRSLAFSAEVPLAGADFTVSAFRTLFFDGKSFRIYKDRTPCVDHVREDVDAPPEVLRAARSFVEEQYKAMAAEGYGVDGSGNYDEGNFGPGNVSWDDWRIIDISGPDFETAGPLQIEIWNLSYETHTTTPDRVILAGGSYMGEDGWCMIGYPGCDYLFFQADEAGNRTYLYSAMENDCSPGTELFLSDLVYALTDQGLLTLADLSGRELARIMWPQSAWFLNNLAEGDPEERDAVLWTLAAYLGGTTEGQSYYAGFVEELEPGGSRYWELTDGSRAAWETLKNLLSGREWALPDMPLPELLRYYAESDGAYAEGAMTELLLRFQADPAALLSALAEEEDGAALAEAVGASIYWNEDLVPGALERAQALDLEGEESALLDRIAAAREAKRQGN